MSHQGAGVLSYCDGSVRSTKSLKLQEDLQIMFDRFIPDPNEAVRF